MCVGTKSPSATSSATPSNSAPPQHSSSHVGERLVQAASTQIQLEMQIPDKPHATKVTHNSLVLSWGKPQCGADSVQSYTIAYRAVDDPPGRWITQTAFNQQEHAEVNDLAAKTAYLFKVRADSSAGVSGPYSEIIETKCLHLADGAEPNSETSDPIKTNCLRLADKMIPRCKPLHILGEAKVYLLPTRETMKKSGILKVTVGQSQQTAPHKVLMLVGTTGTGKTTLITAIANYILGVDWEDKCMFKLISKENGQDQTNRQTHKCITAYTFNKEDSPHPYTLTVIDTPGFGITESGGIEDKQIVQQIKELLTLQGHEGIDQLHGIGFVIQASQTQLTPAQQYVFDNVLSVFGKDLADNIFLMVTFADDKRPPVLDAVKAAGVSFSNHFMLDNSAFCDNNEGQDEGDKMDWQKGRKRLEKFFDHFSGACAQSLDQSREVLQEREQLETTLQDLQSLFQARLAKDNELQQERLSLKVCETDVITYKDFTYHVKVVKQQKVDLPAGQSTTNCLQCNYTCHCPCSRYKDGEKYKCSAMNNRGSLDATCSECPSRCSWKEHVNRPYKIEPYKELEIRSSDDRYESAMTRKGQIEALIRKMEQELQEMDQTILQRTEQAKRSLQHLQEIALSPDHSSKYIDLLIETEKQEARPGWSKHVSALVDIRRAS